MAQQTVIGFSRFFGNSQSDAKLWLHDITAEEIKRMNDFMRKYQDTSMDLADASLVALAETIQMKRIFTIDSDFHIYRLADGSSLEVIP